MASPRKRKLPVEFEDLSDIQEPATTATVNGVVTSFSPMKSDSKKKCFDGYMSSEKKKIRFVGFRHDQQDKISELSRERKPVLLSNCSVKKGDSLEVIIGDYTQVSESEKKYNIDCRGLVESTDMTKDISLGQLKDQVQYQRVSVEVKVVEIGDTTELDDGRKVQNVVVADGTGTAEVALWQDFVGKLVLNKSYKLTNVMVKTFKENNSLFTPKENATFSEIGDLKDVVPLRRSIKRTITITDAKVTAVSDFTSDLICVSCNKGRIRPIRESRAYGRCSQCPTTVLLSSCKLQVSALLTISCNGFQVKLAAVDDKLAAIAGLHLSEVNDLALLEEPVFTVVYNSNMAIVEVSR